MLLCGTSDGQSEAAAKGREDAVIGGEGQQATERDSRYRMACTKGDGMATLGEREDGVAAMRRFLGWNREAGGDAFLAVGARLPTDEHS
jgi:hypothetical protein